MGQDAAAIAADLVALFGLAAEEEARRQLAAACDEDRSRDAQCWISVMFVLARNPAHISHA